MITTQQKEAWQVLASIVSHPRDENDYNRVIRSIHELLDETGGDENHPLAGLVDTLGDIALAYEQDHHKIETASVSPGEMLRFLMEQKGLTQTALEALGFDSQGNISKILSGKREMSLNQIKKACEIFKVSVEAFIGGLGD